MNYIPTQVEFLLSPKIPTKFQEVEFAPKYRVWLEKIRQISQMLNGVDLLRRVISAVCFSEDKSISAMEL